MTASVCTPQKDTTILDASCIRQLIESGLFEQGFSDTIVDVHGPDNVHFQAQVISSAFAGKRPLARHRIVYATLGEAMG